MGRRMVRVATAMLLVASTLVWMPAGAWTSDEGNVSVFTGDFFNSGSLEGLAVAVDGDGNIYTAGTFEVTVDFDPGPGTTNLTPSGQKNVFVSKVDSSGDLVWVKSLAATSATAYGLALDDLDNVYVTGTIWGEVDFNPDPASTYNLGCSLCSSAYVLQLDSSGDFGWAVANSTAERRVTSIPRESHPRRRATNSTASADGDADRHSHRFAETHPSAIGPDQHPPYTLTPVVNRVPIRVSHHRRVASSSGRAGDF